MASGQPTGTEAQGTSEHRELEDAWWEEHLEELDREIARLAALCQVKLLDPGVMERVLKNDTAACGASNAAAFVKLHNLLMMHFALRERSVRAVGQAHTVAIEKEIIERLRKSYPDLGHGGGPA